MNFKHLLFSTLITFSYFGANAQQVNPCIAHDVFLEEKAKYPELLERRLQFEENLEKYQQNKQGQAKSDHVRVIPVVFHIIHNGGTENISKAQILDQLRIMNEDFARLNPDRNNTPSAFVADAANSKIEFRLATKDPQGNCTDGIVRVFSTKTNNADNSNGFKAVSYWNSDSYLNVWVVKNIGKMSNYGTVLGYAQFPASGLMSTDGIAVRHDYIGSTGTAIGRKGRTVTHEIGHWLGLRHIWGDADCGSDGIDDTPTAKDANFGCPTFPHRYTTPTSGILRCTGTDSIRGEMFMNYMDYVNDNCMNMFSKGQKEVMDFVLEGTTGTNGVRSKIWSAENLAATGTENPTTASVCTPVVDFTSNRRMICEGSSITYTDGSFNGTVSSREWTFDGGSPATATTASPTVTYNAPGNYSVKLNATNSTGSGETTKTQFVKVSPSTADYQAQAYYETFYAESTADNWIVINNDGTENKWSWVPYTGYSNNGALKMDNWKNTVTEVDEIISPSFNVSNTPSPVLRFRLAGGAFSTSPKDGLKIYTSVNCGQTWVMKKDMKNAELTNAGQFSTSFVPTSPSQWTEVSVNLGTTLQVPNLRFKFEFTASGGSNNLYIDDINITGPTSSENMVDAQLGILLFPNPASEMVNVSFSLNESKPVRVEMLDLTGREIALVYDGTPGIGEHRMNVKTSGLAAGVYQLRFNYDGGSVSKKLIINN